MKSILGYFDFSVGAVINMPSETVDEHPLLTELHEDVHQNLAFYTNFGLLQCMVASLHRASFRSKEHFHTLRRCLNLLIESSFMVHEGCATFCSLVRYQEQASVPPDSLLEELPNEYIHAVAPISRLLRNIHATSEETGAAVLSTLAEWIGRAALNSPVITAFLHPERLFCCQSLPDELHPDRRLSSIIQVLEDNPLLDDFAARIGEFYVDEIRKAAGAPDKLLFLGPNVYLRLEDFFRTELSRMRTNLPFALGIERRQQEFASLTAEWKKYYGGKGLDVFDRIRLPWQTARPRKHPEFNALVSVRHPDPEFEATLDNAILAPAEAVELEVVRRLQVELGATCRAIASFSINPFETRWQVPPSEPVDTGWAVIRVTYVPCAGDLRCVGRIQITAAPQDIERVLRVLDSYSTAWKVDQRFALANESLRRHVGSLCSPVFAIAWFESLEDIITEIDQRVAATGKAIVILRRVDPSLKTSACSLDTCVVTDVKKKGFVLYRVTPLLAGILQIRFDRSQNVLCFSTEREGGGQGYYKEFNELDWAIVAVPLTVYGHL